MDWREEKRYVLDHASCVVFKVGSAVLTDSAGLRFDVLRDLARQMTTLATRPDGSARRIVLVTSAAVAAGRRVLAACGVHDTSGLSARQAAAAVGQGRLIRAWDDAFQEFGCSIAQVLLTRDDLRSTQRSLNAQNTFAELLAWRVIPVVNENDTVATQELKFGDNDTLSSLLVPLVGADLFVNITSAPGVYDSSPLENSDAKVMPVVEDVASLNLERMCGGKTTVGTGGMYSKLLAARRVSQRGVPTLVVSGKDADVLVRAFAKGNEDFGTWVRPASHAVPARKFWLAYRTVPVGTIDVDDGARAALVEKGSSLLPGGIVNVSGTFQKGALVRVMHGKESLGVGLSNYSAAQIKRIKGLKRFEIAAILGDAHYPEVIHRDNLLIDAAV